MAKNRSSQQIAFIINECLEGVEKSNIGSIYVKDHEGNIKRDSMGIPLCQMVNTQVFLTVLNHELLNGGLY